MDVQFLDNYKKVGIHKRFYNQPGISTSFDVFMLSSIKNANFEEFELNYLKTQL